MFRIFCSESAKKNRKFKTTPLGVEQLESRLLNAVDGIESLLAPLVSPYSVGSTQLVSSNNLRSTNTAPRVQTAPKLQTGVEVRGTSARLVVQGSDDQGESKLIYTWSVLSAPSGGTVSFDINGTNKAKGATASFTRAGQYQFRVVITDQAGLSTQSTLRVQVAQTPTALQAFSSQGTPLSEVVDVTSTSQSVVIRGTDQFGQPISRLSSLTWSAVKQPSGGKVTAMNGNTGTYLSFTKTGSYTLRATSGNATVTVQLNVIPTLTSISLKVAVGNASTTFQVNVARTFSTLEAVYAANTAINPRTPVATSGTSIAVSLRGVDQFGRSFTEAPDANWSVVSGPTDNSTQFSTTRGVTTISFNRAGTYVLRAAAGNSSFTFTVAVSQRVASLSLTPGTASLDAGGRLQFRATGVDQFGNAVTNLGAVAWSASGGTISTAGMFQAGSQGGAFQVTARAGQITASVSGTIASAGAHSALTNSTLRSLVSSLHADNSITRLEMIQILRSVGNDGVVGSDELADLRLLVSSNSGFLMPAYVRELAKDVVNSNPANARFRGQSAGNLSAGSSATLLNNLVDKWFLGADLPIITGGGITYQTANGVLFSGSPSRNDARQGYIGDCYFIASVTSIADQTPAAIQNMFLDNGDGTFTVRFFGPTATDYVTVNRQLPALANGSLAYAGLGLSVSSGTTPLWVALAEKAYAQWNETGQSGRDGINTYAGIEGGWMSNVNRQVLGYASSNYAVSTSNAAHLASQLGGGRAVTIGTKPSVSNGLVGSHAYIVTGYNAGTGTFELFNPWGNTHPGPLTWSQIQANCDFYAVTDSSGTSAISTLSVRSSVSETSIGNWTTVVMAPLHFETAIGNSAESILHDGTAHAAEEYDESYGTMGLHTWTTPDQNPSGAAEQSELVAAMSGNEAGEIRTSDEVANDLAFSFDHIEDLLRS